MKPPYDLYVALDELGEDIEVTAYDPDYEAEQANNNYEGIEYERD